jgi:hypothetical protein
MTSRSRAVALIGCAAVLVAVVGLAAVASAGKRLKTASESIATDPSGNFVEASTATCPAKTKAVSGGFEGEANLSPGGPDLAAVGSLRESKRDWRSSTWNLASNSGTWTSYAYCRKQRLTTSEVEDTFAGTTTSFGDNTTTASCKQGQRAFSGGFDESDFTTESPAVLLPYVSRMDGARRWTTAGVDLSGEEAVTQVAQVNCRKQKKLKTVETSIVLDGTAGAVSDTVTATCGKRQKVVSGGFEIDPVSYSVLGVQYVYASKRAGARMWAVSGYESGATTPLTAFAYCEKKKK